MVFVGAVAVAVLVVPGLARGVALATARRPDPRLLAAASVGAALLIAWRAEGLLHGCALALVALSGTAAGWIDAYERRLPDVLVLPMYPAVGALLLGTGDGDAMLRAVLCAAAGMGVYGIGCVAGQLGFGDVKLAGLLGLALGWMSWQAAAAAPLAAVLIGGVQAVAVLLLRRRDFPFGPAMLLGAAAALAVAPSFWP